jgi:hypothetical protein
MSLCRMSVAVCRWRLYASVFPAAFNLSFLQSSTIAPLRGTYPEMGSRWGMAAMRSVRRVCAIAAIEEALRKGWTSPA